MCLCVCVCVCLSLSLFPTFLFDSPRLFAAPPTLLYWLRALQDVFLHLADLAKDGSGQALITQTTLVLELIAQIIAVMELNAKTTSLTLKLFQLARKHAPDSPVLASLVAAVRERQATHPHLTRLAESLSTF